jgi:hypothetical protein
MSKCIQVTISLATDVDVDEPSTVASAIVSNSLLLDDGETLSRHGKTGEIAFTGSMTVDELLTAAIALAKN